MNIAGIGELLKNTEDTFAGLIYMNNSHVPKRITYYIVTTQSLTGLSPSVDITKCILKCMYEEGEHGTLGTFQFQFTILQICVISVLHNVHIHVCFHRAYLSISFLRMTIYLKPLNSYISVC